MSIARTLAAEDAIVCIADGIFGCRRTEVGAHLHALEDEIDAEAVAPLHLLQAGTHVIFLAHALLGPLDWNVVITGKGLDPVMVLVGALPQHFLGDGAD